MSIFEPSKGIKSASYKNRQIENRIALRQIREYPIFGIGVGNPIQYRMSSNPYQGGYSITGIQWIHNSSLELWLVYGILGLASFAWLSIVFLIRCYILFKNARDPAWQALGISLLAGYIAFLTRAIVTMSILHEPPNIATAALMWGIIEAVYRIYLQPQQNKAAAEAASAKPLGAISSLRNTTA
jgi:O-antigen ligase